MSSTPTELTDLSDEHIQLHLDMELANFNWQDMGDDQSLAYKLSAESIATGLSIYIELLVCNTLNCFGPEIATKVVEKCVGPQLFDLAFKKGLDFAIKTASLAAAECMVPGASIAYAIHTRTVGSSISTIIPEMDLGMIGNKLKLVLNLSMVQSINQVWDKIILGNAGEAYEGLMTILYNSDDPAAMQNLLLEVFTKSLQDKGILEDGESLSTNYISKLIKSSIEAGSSHASIQDKITGAKAHFLKELNANPAMQTPESQKKLKQALKDAAICSVGVLRDRLVEAASGRDALMPEVAKTAKDTLQAIDAQTDLMRMQGYSHIDFGPLSAYKKLYQGCLAKKEQLKDSLTHIVKERCSMIPQAASIALAATVQESLITVIDDKVHKLYESHKIRMLVKDNVMKLVGVESSQWQVTYSEDPTQICQRKRTLAKAGERLTIATQAVTGGVSSAYESLPNLGTVARAGAFVADVLSDHDDQRYTRAVEGTLQVVDMVSSTMGEGMSYVIASKMAQLEGKGAATKYHHKLAGTILEVLFARELMVQSQVDAARSNIEAFAHKDDSWWETISYKAGKGIGAITCLISNPSIDAALRLIPSSEQYTTCYAAITSMVEDKLKVYIDTNDSFDLDDSMIILKLQEFKIEEKELPYIKQQLALDSDFQFVIYNQCKLSLQNKTHGAQQVYNIINVLIQVVPYYDCGKLDEASRDGLSLIHQLIINIKNAELLKSIFDLSQSSQYSMGVANIAKTLRDETILSLASFYGRTDFINHLFTNYPDQSRIMLDSANTSGETPLALSLLTNNPQTARLLIAKGANLMARSVMDGATIVSILAAQSDDRQIESSAVLMGTILERFCYTVGFLNNYLSNEGAEQTLYQDAIWPRLIEELNLVSRLFPNLPSNSLQLCPENTDLLHKLLLVEDEASFKRNVVIIDLINSQTGGLFLRADDARLSAIAANCVRHIHLEQSSRLLLEMRSKLSVTFKPEQWTDIISNQGLSIEQHYDLVIKLLFNGATDIVNETTTVYEAFKITNPETTYISTLDAAMEQNNRILHAQMSSSYRNQMISPSAISQNIFVINLFRIISGETDQTRNSKLIDVILSLNPEFFYNVDVNSIPAEYIDNILANNQFDILHKLFDIGLDFKTGGENSLQAKLEKSLSAYWRSAPKTLTSLCDKLNPVLQIEAAESALSEPKDEVQETAITASDNISVTTAFAAGGTQTFFTAAAPVVNSEDAAVNQNIRTLT